MDDFSQPARDDFDDWRSSVERDWETQERLERVDEARERGDDEREERDDA